MSWFNKPFSFISVPFFCFLVIAFCLLFLQSCDFRPVYRDLPEDEGLKQALTTVDIESIDFGRAGQQLHTHLENLLNPSNVTVSPKYRLSVKLERRRTPQTIEQDREVTRYNLIMTGNYLLKEADTGSTVTSGASRIISSYDAVSSDFATFTAEEDAQSRIMAEMAKDIRFRLVSYFLEEGK